MSTHCEQITPNRDYSAEEIFHPNRFEPEEKVVVKITIENDKTDTSLSRSIIGASHAYCRGSSSSAKISLFKQDFERILSSIGDGEIPRYVEVKDVSPY